LLALRARATVARHGRPVAQARGIDDVRDLLSFRATAATVTWLNRVGQVLIKPSAL